MIAAVDAAGLRSETVLRRDGMFLAKVLDKKISRASARGR
jgi:hypothetical protein